PTVALNPDLPSTVYKSVARVLMLTLALSLPYHCIYYSASGPHGARAGTLRWPSERLLGRRAAPARRVRGQRQRRQAHPDSPGNDVGNGWRHRHQAALANALGPVWPSPWG